MAIIFPKTAFEPVDEKQQWQEDRKRLMRYGRIMYRAAEIAKGPNHFLRLLTIGAKSKP